MLTLEQFKAARATLRGVIRTTSLIHSPALSRACGNQVYLKPENMQVTGAYKIRGAYLRSAPSARRRKPGASSPPPPATTPRGWPMPPRRRGCPPPS